MTKGGCIVQWWTPIPSRILCVCVCVYLEGTLEGYVSTLKKYLEKKVSSVDLIY